MISQARTLIVEGWRTSSHSYALVNQYQLLHLLVDPRLRLLHRDIPTYQSHWAQIPSGLSRTQSERIAAIPQLDIGQSADLTYRISYPFRAYRGAGRTFVFATNELDGSVGVDFVDAQGRPPGLRDLEVDLITPST